MWRAPETLSEESFDLLILGGGITGAGVALDTALRGLRVALIDKGDLAGGTSSASSKLIHGGLRYLEHGQFRLVYEALHERRLLLHNAPHLVHPLRFILPFYQGARVPPWKWRLGLTLYDLLAGSSNLHRHRPLGRPVLARCWPGLRGKGLLGGAEYHDAQMDDARLCLEVLQTADRQGARVVNYVEAVAFERNGSTLSGVRALDRVSGRELRIRARQVLNATGPWVDAIRKLAGETGEPHLQPTKGVHLLAPGRELTAAFLLLHPRDGRVFFVIPWLGKTLIGTTDTFTAEPPDRLEVLPEEIAYLLEGHNHYFSEGLTGNDVLGSFAGLRPLLRARPEAPSARSREFGVFPGPTGLLSVAGGKYTTYRHMAEVITDEVCRYLGHCRPCRTRTFRLDGAPAGDWAGFRVRETWALQSRYGLSEETASHLVCRYGRRAAEVAAYVVSEPGRERPVVAGEPDVRGEFVYQREHEMAVFPEDCLLRRTRLGLFRPAVELDF